MTTDDPFQSEPYEVDTSDGRRFIMEAADPETLRRNFPAPGESIRVISVRPVVSRENLLTVHELAQALRSKDKNAPHWQTLLEWARRKRIPSQRIGRKYLRFVELHVRTAIKGWEDGRA